MKIDRESYAWEEINGFRNRGAFNDFLSWIDEQAQTKVAIEISTPPKALCKNLRDKWFVHNESRVIWHLIWPDITTLTGSFKVYIENYNDTWTKVDTFHNWIDYKLFVQWLDKQIKLDKAKWITIDDFTMQNIKLHTDAIDFPEWNDNDLVLEWLNKQIKLDKAKMVNLVSPVEGTFIQIESGQVWQLWASERSFGWFKRIKIVNKYEKLARLEFLFNEYYKILKENNGRNYIKDITKILKGLTNDKGSAEERLDAACSHYHSLLGGHGTLERFVLYHEDEEIQKELNNYLTELMQEICSLLDLRFSRLPRVEEGYPPGHIYWSIKDPKGEDNE